MYILLNYCEKYSEPSKKNPGLQISRKKLFKNGLRFFWYIYPPLNKEIEIVLYEKASRLYQLFFRRYLYTHVLDHYTLRYYFNKVIPSLYKKQLTRIRLA